MVTSDARDEEETCQMEGGVWQGKGDFSVLVVGNTYLDEFVELPCFPSPDGKFTVQSIVDDIGGSATNACCAFQKYLSTSYTHLISCTLQCEQQNIFQFHQK